MALPILDIPKRYKNGKPYLEVYVDDIKNSIEEWALKIVRDLTQIAIDTHGPNYPYENTGSGLRSVPLVDYFAALSENETVTGNWTFTGTVSYSGAIEFLGPVTFEDSVEFNSPEVTFNGVVNLLDDVNIADYVFFSGIGALVYPTVNGYILHNGYGESALHDFYSASSGNNPSRINLHTSRGIIASPSISQNSDYAGSIYTYLYDGSTWQETSYIYTQASSAPAAENTPCDMILGVNLGSTTATEIMRLSHLGYAIFVDRIRVGVTNGNVILGGAPASNGTGQFQFITCNATNNWCIANNLTVSSALEFIPSTAAGGSTFTTAILTLSPVGDANFKSGLFYVDATNSRTYFGATTTTTVSGVNAKRQVIAVDGFVDSRIALNDGAQGVIEYNWHNSASPAANDVIYYQRMFGNDSGGNITSFVEVYAKIEDPTDASEDGSYTISVKMAGVTREALKCDASGATIYGGITVTTGNVVFTAGNLTLTLGDVTLTNGDLTLTSGAISLSGDITIDADSTYNLGSLTNYWNAVYSDQYIFNAVGAANPIITTNGTGTIQITPTDNGNNSRTLGITYAGLTKTTGGAPYTNDGYIVVQIGGSDIRVMTTA